jgi:hypothetical protein
VRVFGALQNVTRFATPPPTKLEPTHVPPTEKQPEAISIPLANVDVEFPLTVRVLRRSPFKVEEPVMPRVAAAIPPVKVEVPVLSTERLVTVVEPKSARMLPA